jgi:MerR family redox-sensitive transcriptional activator SoxR
MTGAPWGQAGGRTVSDVARDSGVAPSAVRFYERHGLVSSRRTAGNQRRFDDDAACRIKAARVAQRVGLSLSEIAGLLAELPSDATVEDWMRLHDTLAAEGERRIAELRAALLDIASERKLCEL